VRFDSLTIFHARFYLIARFGASFDLMARFEARFDVKGRFEQQKVNREHVREGGEYSSQDMQTNPHTSIPLKLD
jgi:hypothetical protein